MSSLWCCERNWKWFEVSFRFLGWNEEEKKALEKAYNKKYKEESIKNVLLFVEHAVGDFPGIWFVLFLNLDKDKFFERLEIFRILFWLEFF